MFLLLPIKLIVTSPHRILLSVGGAGTEVSERTSLAIAVALLSGIGNAHADLASFNQCIFIESQSIDQDETQAGLCE